MKNTITGLFILFLSFQTHAQTWDDTLKKIDAIFSKYKADRPGGQLAISRNGTVIFSKAWGMASMEHDARLLTTSMSEAGSVSKQFTAFAILLLVQQGKCKPDDDVRRYLPLLPDYGTPITIQHLLNHTSGLKDWGSVAVLSGWPRQTKTYNNADALQISYNQKNLNFKPGDEYSYSNSNYVLLAKLVEVIANEGFESFCRRFIFEPAGMKNTEWRSNFKKIVKNRALAYSKGTTSYETNMPNEHVFGAGGLLTTAEDLLAWNKYYLSTKPGGEALLKMQLQRGVLNSGRIITYASGLIVDTVNKEPVIQHDGATASYRAMLCHFPGKQLSISWLSNTSEFDNDQKPATQQLIDYFIPGPPPEFTPEPKVYTADDKMLARVGWYQNQRDGSALKITVKRGILFSRNNTLSPVDDQSMLASNNGNIFQFGPDKQLNIRVRSGDIVPYVAVDSIVKLTEKEAAEYFGTYRSDEAGGTFQFLEKNDKLFLTMSPDTEYMVDPTYKDGFDTPLGHMVFVRNRKGKITGFKISISRARNMYFERLREK
jgi:CubicO group peptidase (beta-lactamase class C family)